MERNGSRPGNVKRDHDDGKHFYKVYTISKQEDENTRLIGYYLLLQ